MTDKQLIKKVVIVGGGTAGWMAAATLAKTLNKSISVTLIESDEISTVGVGEATVPPLILFNRYLEINEKEFLSFVKGTIKLGIQFENWKNINHSYIHAFGYPGKDTWAASFQHFWRRGLELGIDFPLSAYSIEAQAALKDKFAHLSNTPISYAFHIDAGYYAKYLGSLAKKLGAERIEGKVVSVTLDDNRFIESVHLDSGQSVEGDLFIDCTGMRALLIEETLHTGFEDWSHWLPCDRAIAVQTESVREPRPYTRSIAHHAGWQWQIPLQHRVGNGIVYSSRYMSDDEALSLLNNNIEGKQINEPRVIKYRTGKRLKFWNNNCVALGLSSGFVEPLESTSIHLVQRGITRLVQMFPYGGINACDINEYNEQMKIETDNIRDFIVMHYHLTARDDSPFWRFCKKMPVPGSLLNRMEMFEKTGKVYVKSNELFVESSWVQVMVGQGLLPATHHPIANQLSDDDLNNFLMGLRNTISRTLERMPSHNEYLNHYCKASDWT